MDAPSPTTLTRARKYVTKRHPDPVGQSVRIVAFQARETGQQRVRVPAVPGVERAVEVARGEFPELEFLVEHLAAPAHGTDKPVGEFDAPQSFLSEVYARSRGDQGALLDYIYDTLDDLLLTGCYESCDAAIREVDVRQISVEGMIGLLTISLSAKHLLPSRPALVDRVEGALRAARPASEVRELLKGLT